MAKMTLEEKVALIDAADEAEVRGNFEEAERLKRSIPLAPGLAKGLLESQGLDAVLAAGFNLSEVIERHGEAWLEQFRRS